MVPRICCLITGSHQATHRSCLSPRTDRLFASTAKTTRPKTANWTSYLNTCAIPSTGSWGKNGCVTSLLLIVSFVVVVCVPPLDPCLRRATRRKLDKDSNASPADGDGQDRQTPCDESKNYLETTIFECVAPEYKLREIVDRPEGVDISEWLAFNSESVLVSEDSSS